MFRHPRWGGLAEAAVALAAMVLFAAAFSYPVLRHLSNIGVVWDWPEFLIRNWVAYHSVRDFHQVPLWNPYECGGMPLLAHPSSQIMTPLFLLPLLFGPFVGLNLQIPAHLAIAWSGGYVLARTLGMNRMGRLVCASIFPASSWFYLHVGVGHLNFLPTAYLPWIAAAVLMGSERGAIMPWIAAGLLLAVMFGEGGVYQPTQAVMLSMLIALWMAAMRRSWWPLAGILLMLTFAAGLGAIKLLPSIQMMRMHPRPVEDIEYSPLRVLFEGLFTRYQYYDRQRIEGWGFWEAGAYLGPGAVLLALFGLVGRTRRCAPWLMVAALFLLLAVGGPRWWFPWAMLHHLPVFAWERMPERFLILFVLSIGVIAAYGADFIAARYKTAGAIAMCLILVAALADAWTVSRPNMEASVAGPVPDEPPRPQFVQDYEDPWSMLSLALSNRGALHCNEELDFHEPYNLKAAAINRPGYRGEYYLLGPGTAALRRWTPNALSYDVVSAAGNILVINQNYDSNWKLARGRGQVGSYHGLLAVRAAGGAQHITLVYRSDFFVLGAVISLLTCVGAAAIGLRERRARLEKRRAP